MSNPEQCRAATLRILQCGCLKNARSIVVDHLGSVRAAASRSPVHLIRSVMCNVALMVSRCYAIRTTKYDSFLVNVARTGVMWTSSDSASRSLAHEAKEYRFSSSSSSACRDRTTVTRRFAAQWLEIRASEYCYAYLHRCKRTLFRSDIKIIAGAFELGIFSVGIIKK